MKQTFNIGMIPSNKDQVFDDTKKALVEQGIVEENTPDDVVGTKIVENVVKVREDLANVKQALADTGLASPTTPNEMLPTAIEENVKALKEKIVPTWEDIDIGSMKKTLLKPFDYIFYPSDGRVAYCSYSDSKFKGLYRWDLITNEVTIIDNGIYNTVAFFEDSKGNIYFNGSGSKLYYLDKTDESITLINSEYAWNTFFEDSKGNVYVTSQESYGRSGILYLNKKEVPVKVFSTGSIWNTPYEDRKGNVYIASKSSSVGLLLLNGSKPAVQLIDTGRYWSIIQETDTGNLLCTTQMSASSTVPGIYKINNGQATLIYDTGYAWKILFEDKDGFTYLGSAVSNTPGILCFDKNNIEVVYETGYNWRLIFNKGDEYAYLTNTISSYLGLIYIGNKTAELIQSVGYSWDYFFESSKGDVYASNAQGGVAGIVHLNKNVAKQVYTLGKNWRYFFESSKGDVYISSSEYNKLVQLNGSNDATVVYDKDHSWCFFFEDSNNNLYITSNSGSNSNTGVLYKEDSELTLIPNSNVSMYQTKIFFESNNGDIFMYTRPNGIGYKQRKIYALTADNCEILYTGREEILIDFVTDIKQGVAFSQTEKYDKSKFIFVDNSKNVYVVEE